MTIAKHKTLLGQCIAALLVVVGCIYASFSVADSNSTTDNNTDQLTGVWQFTYGEYTQTDGSTTKFTATGRNTQKQFSGHEFMISSNLNSKAVNHTSGTYQINGNLLTQTIADGEETQTYQTNFTISDVDGTKQLVQTSNENGLQVKETWIQIR